MPSRSRPRTTQAAALAVGTVIASGAGIAVGGSAAADVDFTFYNGDLCAYSFCYPRSTTYSMNDGTLYRGGVPVQSGTYWRAGSGNGSTNRCAVNAGPIPFGGYTITEHRDHFSGSDIHGRVFALSDMACYKGGQIRDELFIHTEEGINQEQSGAEQFRWDGNNDYYSLGCVKVSHKDMGAVDYTWHVVSDSNPRLSVDP